MGAAQGGTPTTKLRGHVPTAHPGGRIGGGVCCVCGGGAVAHLGQRPGQRHERRRTGPSRIHHGTRPARLARSAKIALPAEWPQPPSIIGSCTPLRHAGVGPPSGSCSGQAGLTAGRNRYSPSHPWCPSDHGCHPPPAQRKKTACEHKPLLSPERCEAPHVKKAASSQLSHTSSSHEGPPQEGEAAVASEASPILTLTLSLAHMRPTVSTIPSLAFEFTPLCPKCP